MDETAQEDMEGGYKCVLISLLFISDCIFSMRVCETHRKEK